MKEEPQYHKFAKANFKGNEYDVERNRRFHSLVKRSRTR